MKTFKIAYVLPNGLEMYYGYRAGIPYLTRYIGAAYQFNCECYPTQGLKEDEAERLKEGFFGVLKEVKIIAKVII